MDLKVKVTQTFADGGTPIDGLPLKTVGGVVGPGVMLLSAKPREKSRNVASGELFKILDKSDLWWVSSRSTATTPRLTARKLPVLRVCAMFEGLTEFSFVFRFGFRASLLTFTSRIERL